MQNECLPIYADAYLTFFVPVFSVYLFDDVIIEIALFRFIFNLIPSEFGIIMIVVFIVVRNDILRKDLYNLIYNYLTICK